MKKFVAMLLIFLLSMTSIAAAEADFSSYTDAELRTLRAQLDTTIHLRASNEEAGEAVCDAFMQNMQTLGHSIEYRFAYDDEYGFAALRDTQLNSESIDFLINGGYEIMLNDDLASNEAYVRDCMVALAIATAQVEGVEIFSNDIQDAAESCSEALPDGFLASNVVICWDNDDGYHWLITKTDDYTLVDVR